MAKVTKKKPVKKSKPSVAPVSKVAAEQRPDAGVVIKTTSQTVVRKTTWWQRIWPEREGRVESQMAALRRNVMTELSNLNKGQRFSRPFENVILPESQPRAARRQDGGDWLFTGFVVVAVAAIVLLLLIGGRSGSGAGAALTQMMAAIEERDVSAFTEVVNVDRVATRAVDDLFGTPALGSTDLPTVLKNKVANASRLEPMVKPGLVATLSDDILQAVKSGQWQGEEPTMLGRLWRDAGGEALEIGAPKLKETSEDEARAEVLITRDDSGQVAEVLTLRLVQESDGRWRVVEVRNVAPALARLNAIETRIAVAESQMAGVEPAARLSGGLGEVLRVTNVKKEATKGDVMSVRLTMANTGDKAIRKSVVWVTFSDAAGTPLRTVELEDGEPLSAGMRRERVLPVPVNRNKKLQRWVAELPLSALTVQARVMAAN